MSASSPAPLLTSGLDVRRAAREQALDVVTAGLAPGYLQANLIVLPSRYAADFRLLCARNPVPCPLLAESATPGAFSALRSHLAVEDGEGGVGSKKTITIADDVDLRRDAPRYRVYVDGQLVPGQPAEEQPDIVAEWTADHVGFLIGCSYSFEAALARAGLPPRHQLQQRNVPMYRTAVPLCPAGVFSGATMVVSMRPYRAADVEAVRAVTRPFVQTHGEPVAWGWDGMRRLGIADLARPDWGDAALVLDGSGAPFAREDQDGGAYVPVFWGCGVTPQNAVAAAQLPGTVMGHAPGYMIVLDTQEADVFQ